MVAANCLFTEGSSSLRNWVAVKELNLSYFIEETTFLLSIYMYILPLWQLNLSSLTANQERRCSRPASTTVGASFDA